MMNKNVAIVVVWGVFFTSLSWSMQRQGPQADFSFFIAYLKEAQQCSAKPDSFFNGFFKNNVFINKPQVRGILGEDQPLVTIREFNKLIDGYYWANNVEKKIACIRSLMLKDDRFKSAMITYMVQEKKFTRIYGSKRNLYVSNDPYLFDLLSYAEPTQLNDQGFSKQMILDRLVHFILNNQIFQLQDDLESFRVKTFDQDGWGYGNGEQVAVWFKNFLIDVLMSPISKRYILNTHVVIGGGASLIDVAFLCKNYNAAFILTLYGAQKVGVILGR